MGIVSAPDTVTRDEYRVMRQIPGRAPRVWNTQMTRAEALACIRAERLSQNSRVKFGILRVQVTEIIHGIDWEPDDI